MAIPNIRRRLLHLEAAYVQALRPDFPPYTAAEIAELSCRMDAGESMSAAELARLEQHAPVGNSEVVIVSCRNGVVKRLMGVDYAAL
jgi:hypothetical protein